MVKLEEGKYYRDARGRKIGPMHQYGSASSDPYRWKPMNHRGWWDENGKAHESTGEVNLVAEWTDAEPKPAGWFLDTPNGPTRTVTRLEVVPGVYGQISVHGLKGDTRVTVSFADTSEWTHLTADELEAAAAVLTELAKAVRDV